MNRTRRLPAVLLALAALAAIPAGARTAFAQTPPPQGDKPAAAPVLDQTGRTLGEKTDALAKEAKVLVEAYTKALDARVRKLADENATLKRLYTAGLFNKDTLLAGVSADPLPALPEIRRVYESLDKTAQNYIEDFGGIAKARGESAAAAFMTRVIAAQNAFREDDKDGNGILEYAPSFLELGMAGLLQVGPVKRGEASIAVEGYKFRIIAADTLHWAADAAPLKPGETGDVWLYADETGIIRAEKGKPATQTSPQYVPEKPAGK